MSISVFDIFTIGIGPSSSHTVEPMKAAGLFVDKLRAQQLLPVVQGLKVELVGSLGATGRGHGSPNAIMLGLEGEQPATVDIDAIPKRIEAIHSQQQLRLGGEFPITFDPQKDLLLHRDRRLKYHPNGRHLPLWTPQVTRWYKRSIILLAAAQSSMNRRPVKIN